MSSAYKAVETNLQELIQTAKDSGSVLKANVFVGNSKTKQNGQIDILEITKDGKYKTYNLKTNFKEFTNVGQKLKNLKTYSTEQEIANKILTEGDPTLGIQAGEVVDSKILRTVVKTNRFGNVTKVNNTNVIAPTFLRTDDRNLNNLIIKLQSQIGNLETRVKQTSNPTEKAAINELLDSKLELVQNLQLRKDIESVVAHAGNDLIYIENLVKESEINQIKKDSAVIKESLNLYSELPKLLDKKNLSQKLQDKLTFMEGKANDLRRRFYDIGINITEGEATRTGVMALGEKAGFGNDIFAPQKDIGGFFQWVMGTSNVNNPLVATGYRIMTEAQAKIRVKMQVLADNLEVAIKEFKDYTKGQSYDLVIQQDKDGKFTKNLVDKHSHEFYKQRDRATAINDEEWFKDNVDYNKEEFEKAYQKQEDFLDAYAKTKKDQIKAALVEQGMNEGKLLEQKVEEDYLQYRKFEFDKWIAQNKNNKGLYYTPKSIWIDPKWKVIKEGQYKGTPVERFYDLHKKYIEMANEIAPEHLKSNFIANFSQDFIEKYSELGILGGIKSSWSGILQNLRIGTDQNEYGKIDSFTGESINSLYIPGIQRLEAGNKSMDLGKNLFMFMEGIYRYQEMGAIEDTILDIKDQLGNANYIKLNSLGRPSNRGIPEQLRHSKTSQVFESQIDAVIYGKKRELDRGVEVTGNGFTAALGILGKGDKIKLSYAKMVDKVLYYTMLHNLSFNMYAPMTNILPGTCMMYATGAGGVDYNNKELSWAVGIVTAGRLHAKSADSVKAHLIIDMLQLEANEFVKSKSAKFSSNRFESFTNEYNGLTMMRGTENMMHEAGALAMLKSGKHSYTWDDFEVVDGKLVNNKSTAPLDIEKFRQKVIRVNGRNVGNMNQDDFVMAKKYILGRILMQHRSWLPTTLIERFGAKRFDYVLEREVQGRYLAASSAAYKLAKEFLSHGSLANLTELEKEAFKNAMAELSTFALVGLLLMGLNSLDDSKKKQAWYNYTHRITNRTFAELTFYVSYSSAKQIITSPGASISAVENFSTLIRDTWREGMADYYDDPAHTRKMAKPGRRAVDMLPPLGQVRRFIDDLYAIDPYK
jgi:hypothetical protein